MQALHDTPNVDPVLYDADTLLSSQVHCMPAPPLLAQSQMGVITCRLLVLRILWHMSTSLPHNPTGIWTSAAQLQQQSGHPLSAL